MMEYNPDNDYYGNGYYFALFINNNSPQLYSDYNSAARNIPLLNLHSFSIELIQINQPSKIIYSN